MTRFIAVFCLAVGLTATLHAQTPARVTPEQVDKIFAKWNNPDSPGCALAVLQNGGAAYERGYGMADLEHDVPITPSTPFNVGSVAKQFTAAAVLLLAEQGKLSMDDDVRKYIPELPDFGVTIRVRHLLHHTSGLREQIQLLQLAGWRYPLDFMSETDVMSLVRRQKDLNFPPGANYLYSNTGFMLLGQIVKKVSGLSLREFTTKNIFEPLGMRNSPLPRRPLRDHQGRSARIRADEGRGFPAERSEFRHCGIEQPVHHGRGPGEVGRQFLLAQDWRPGFYATDDKNGEAHQRHG